MNKLKTYLLAMGMLSGLCSTASTQLKPLPMEPTDAEVDPFIEVEFVDNFGNGMPVYNIPVLEKTERVQNTAGQIILKGVENLPDSVLIATLVAADMWESVIPASSVSKIEVLFKPLTDNDVEVSVKYAPLSQNNDTIVPASVYHLYNLRVNDSPDATITLNSNVKWECGYSENYCNGRNVTFAMLRAMAISFGFGSSVRVQNVAGQNRIVFPHKSGQSVFDKLILSSDGKYLRDIKNIGIRNNPKLNSFVQPPEGISLYVGNISSENKLYAPSEFENHKSLIYLDNPNSLMHYDLNEGSKMLNIDSITVKLLNDIGWGNTHKAFVEIQGEDISDDGIASAYLPHRFSLCEPNGITEGEWSLELPLKSGMMDTLYTAKGTEWFEIPVIEDFEPYQRNINGDIYGRIRFNGKRNGNPIYGLYRVSLELKPIINAVNILKKEKDSYGMYYDLYYTVEYAGGDKVKAHLEQDGMTTIRSQSVKEPFLAHIVTTNIMMPFWAWLTIEVENKYGKTTETLELPSLPEDESTAHNIANNISIKAINLITLQEFKLNHDNDYLKLPKGMYVISYYKNGELSKTEKLIK